MKMMNISFNLYVLKIMLFHAFKTFLLPLFFKSLENDPAKDMQISKMWVPWGAEFVPGFTGILVVNNWWRDLEVVWLYIQTQTHDGSMGLVYLWLIFIDVDFYLWLVSGILWSIYLYMNGWFFWVFIGRYIPGNSAFSWPFWDGEFTWPL